jgi:hypothetical protein
MEHRGRAQGWLLIKRCGTRRVNFPAACASRSTNSRSAIARDYQPDQPRMASILSAASRIMAGRTWA